MGNIEKPGLVVWHDLHTTDISLARSFYERVVGWSYATEHAKDVVWEGGEKDYVLALVGGEAHAGFVERRRLPNSVWLQHRRRGVGARLGHLRTKGERATSTT